MKLYQIKENYFLTEDGIVLSEKTVTPKGIFNFGKTKRSINAIDFGDKEYIILKDTLLLKEGRAFKILKIETRKNGYNYIKLKTKWFRYARLKMMLLCPTNNMEELEVDHINRVKNDDRLENLRWVTKSDNLRNRENDKIVNNLGEHLRVAETFEVFNGEDKVCKGTFKEINIRLGIKKTHFYDLVKTGKISKVNGFRIIKCND